MILLVDIYFRNKWSLTMDGFLLQNIIDDLLIIFAQRNLLKDNKIVQNGFSNGNSPHVGTVFLTSLLNDYSQNIF